MKTLHIQGSGTLQITEVPEPVPGPGEVVIQTAASALCGSELGNYRDDGKPSGNNGHEGAGIVIGLGPEVEGLQLGQRVGVSAVAGCGRCSHCRKGQYTYCHKVMVYTNMHAEQFLAAAHACHPLPEDVPFDVGGLISGDGLGVPYHTNSRFPLPSAETVAVFGSGPIGLGNSLLQSHLGRRVIAVDLLPDRLDLARKLGAGATLNPSDRDVVDEIRSLTDGKGADVCIEAAGRPETARQCFQAVRHGGAVAFNGEQPALELSPSDDFIRRDITAFGSWYCHFNEFDDLLKLWRNGLQVDSLITHRFPLEEAQTAFTEFDAGRTGKVLLTY